MKYDADIMKYNVNRKKCDVYSLKYDVNYEIWSFPVKFPLCLQPIQNINLLHSYHT